MAATTQTTLNAQNLADNLYTLSDDKTAFDQYVAEHKPGLAVLNETAKILGLEITFTAKKSAAEAIFDFLNDATTATITNQTQSSVDVDASSIEVEADSLGEPTAPTEEQPTETETPTETEFDFGSFSPILASLADIPESESRLAILQAETLPEVREALAKKHGFVDNPEEKLRAFDEFMYLIGAYSGFQSSTENTQLPTTQTDAQIAQIAQIATKPEEPKPENTTKYDLSLIQNEINFRKSASEVAQILENATPVGFRSKIELDTYPLSDGKSFVRYTYKSCLNGIEIFSVEKTDIPICKIIIAEKDDMYKLEVVPDDKNGNRRAKPNKSEVRIKFPYRSKETGKDEVAEYDKHLDFVNKFLFPEILRYRIWLDIFKYPDILNPFAAVFPSLLEKQVIQHIRKIGTDAATPVISPELQETAENKPLTQEQYDTLYICSLGGLWQRRDLHTKKSFSSLKDTIIKQLSDFDDEYREGILEQAGLVVNLHPQKTITE